VAPGSVMKTFTFGAALEAGVVTPETRVSGEDGGWRLGARTIRDASPHGELSLEDVLAFSSNVGTAKVFERLGHARLEATLKALGLPTPPMPDDEAAVGVSYGADVSPTPLEVARAYAAIASGKAFPAHGKELLALLQRTVDREDGTGKGARIPGVAVAGKTGTAPLGEGRGAYGDFVGILPADAPRFVVLVGLETSARGYSGGSVAAPAFARLGARLLR
jgi:cell division protein FtsI (penicillin-binding protein 3)